jgi:quercetin dioxygenase-like cupin family protein
MNKLTIIQLTQPDSVVPKTTISKNFFKSPNLKTMLFSFAEGEELSNHSSKKDAILHVLNGNGTFATEQETVSLSEGTWIHIPAELTHRVEAGTELHFLLYLVG